MNTNTTNKDLNLQREHEVWELRKRCYNQSQIARKLNITQGAVSQILKRIRTRLADQFDGEARQLLSEQVAQLLHIAQEALEAWEQSKQQSPPQPQPDAPTPNAPTPTAPTPRPAYLRIAMKALADIRAIREKHATDPSRVDPNFQEIKMLIGIDYDHMKNQDGVPVPRKVIDQLLQENDMA